MAIIDFHSDITVFPGIEDLTVLLEDLLLVSAGPGSVVLENSLGRITLTSAGGSQQFGGFADYGVPTTGSVADVKIEVYSPGGPLVTYCDIDYGAEPLLANFVLDGIGSTVVLDLEALLSQADTIGGTAGADRITGGYGRDTLRGGGGNDTLDGASLEFDGGSDSMLGGSGNDVYIVNSATDIVVETASGGIDTAVLHFCPTFVLPDHVENGIVDPKWLGPGYSFVALTGNALANVLRGGAGANSLAGAEGNDRLYGSSGNDTLIGGLGSDSMFGGDGSDLYYVDSVGDYVLETAVDAAFDTVIAEIDYTLGGFLEVLRLAGAAGDIDGTGNALDNFILANGGSNVLNGRGGIDSLGYVTTAIGVTVTLDSTSVQVTGGSGSDLVLNFENLTGGTGNDSLTGSSGANRLDGYLGTDTLMGLAGDDVFVVDNPLDVVIEGADGGRDRVETSTPNWTLGENLEDLSYRDFGYSGFAGTGNGLQNEISGGQDRDTLMGLGGADTLLGDIGNDTLDGGVGADLMNGGLGSDTYLVDHPDDVVIDAYEVDVPGYAVFTNTIIAAIDYVLVPYIDNLILTGPARRGAGNDLDNVITASGADNILNGAAGIDTLSYAGTTGGVSISLAVLGAQTTGGSGRDSIRNFENLSGGAGNDRLTGDAQDNVLDGGSGTDTLVGREGNDTFIVDSTADSIVESSGNGLDTTLAYVNFTLPANVENLTLAGFQTEGVGNAENNRIVAYSTENRLVGRGGNDTLIGGGVIQIGGGLDTLDGGTGDDVYILADNNATVLDSGGVDTVEYEAYSVGDEGGYVLPRGIENLILTSAYTFGGFYAHGSGNALANRLVGNAAANTLRGAGGADTIHGGAGYDTLTGGAGADTFLFDTPFYTGFDTLTDFVPGTDRIHLDAGVFAALPYTADGAFAAGHLRIGSQALDAVDRIVYNSTSGDLFYDPDGSGAQEAIQFAVLPAGLALTAQDFLVI